MREGICLVEETDKKRIVSHVIDKVQTVPGFRSIFYANPEDAVMAVGQELGVELDPKQVEKIVKSVEKAATPLSFLTYTEMKILLKDITDGAAKGYRKTQYMWVALFILGWGIVAGAFVLDVYGILQQVNWENLVASSGVIGAIGLATIWQSMNRLPDQVKKSAAQLVQLYVCFFAFLDQLSIFMGLERKTLPDATKIAGEIDKATKEAAKNIGNYCGTKEVPTPSSAERPNAGLDKP